MYLLQTYLYVRKIHNIHHIGLYRNTIALNLCSGKEGQWLWINAESQILT